MKLTPRQEEIVRLVKEGQPITSETLAGKLGAIRTILRPDLAILTMIGVLGARPKVECVYSDKPSNSFIYEKIKSIEVKDMTSKPVTVCREATLHDAIVYLFLNDVGTMFVENGRVLTGAVSRKDLLKIAMGGIDIYEAPVGITVTRIPNIICAVEEDCAFDVVKKTIKREIDSVSVVRRIEESEGKERLEIMGKTSKTNIIKSFVKLGKN